MIGHMIPEHQARQRRHLRLSPCNPETPLSLLRRTQKIFAMDLQVEKGSSAHCEKQRTEHREGRSEIYKVDQSFASVLG